MGRTWSPAVASTATTAPSRVVISGLGDLDRIPPGLRVSRPDGVGPVRARHDHGRHSADTATTSGRRSRPPRPAGARPLGRLQAIGVHARHTRTADRSLCSVIRWLLEVMQPVLVDGVDRLCNRTLAKRDTRAIRLQRPDHCVEVGHGNALSGPVAVDVGDDVCR